MPKSPSSLIDELFVSRAVIETNASMPVPTRVTPEKNIWIAAGDGDLSRVQELVEAHSISPNVPDPNTYTPMHAAASYGHIHVLEYLVSHGGDVNVTDSDGDTPLYTVENVETAQWLVEHGAEIDRLNYESVTPIEHLEEDFPEVSAYLRSHSTASADGPGVLPQSTAHQQPSQHSQDVASENLTESLMESVQGIVERAEAEGRDPEDELREVVSRTVLEGMRTGYEMSTESDPDTASESNGSKRPRTNGG